MEGRQPHKYHLISLDKRARLCLDCMQVAVGIVPSSLFSKSFDVPCATELNPQQAISISILMKSVYRHVIWLLIPEAQTHTEKKQPIDEEGSENIASHVCLLVLIYTYYSALKLLSQKKAHSESTFCFCVHDKYFRTPCATRTSSRCLEVKALSAAGVFLRHQAPDPHGPSVSKSKNALTLCRYESACCEASDCASLSSSALVNML